MLRRLHARPGTGGRGRDPLSYTDRFHTLGFSAPASESMESQHASLLDSP